MPRWRLLTAAQCSLSLSPAALNALLPPGALAARARWGLGQGSGESPREDASEAEKSRSIHEQKIAVIIERFGKGKGGAEGEGLEQVT